MTEEKMVDEIIRLEIQDLINQYGMQRILQELIDCTYSPDEYIAELNTNLQFTLDKYKERNDGDMA